MSVGSSDSTGVVEETWPADAVTPELDPRRSVESALAVSPPDRRPVMREAGEASRVAV
jgi:hypothetical protein